MATERIIPGLEQYRVTVRHRIREEFQITGPIAHMRDCTDRLRKMEVVEQVELLFFIVSKHPDDPSLFLAKGSWMVWE